MSPPRRPAASRSPERSRDLEDERHGIEEALGRGADAGFNDDWLDELDEATDGLADRDDFSDLDEVAAPPSQQLPGQARTRHARIGRPSSKPARPAARASRRGSSSDLAAADDEKKRRLIGFLLTGGLIALLAAAGGTFAVLGRGGDDPTDDTAVAADAAESEFQGERLNEGEAERREPAAGQNLADDATTTVLKTEGTLARLVAYQPATPRRTGTNLPAHIEAYPRRTAASIAWPAAPRQAAAANDPSVDEMPVAWDPIEVGGSLDAPLGVEHIADDVLKSVPQGRRVLAMAARHGGFLVLASQETTPREPRGDGTGYFTAPHTLVDLRTGDAVGRYDRAIDPIAPLLLSPDGRSLIEAIRTPPALDAKGRPVRRPQPRSAERPPVTVDLRRWEPGQERPSATLTTQDEVRWWTIVDGRLLMWTVPPAGDDEPQGAVLPSRLVAYDLQRLQPTRERAWRFRCDWLASAVSFAVCGWISSTRSSGTGPSVMMADCSPSMEPARMGSPSSRSTSRVTHRCDCSARPRSSRETIDCFSDFAPGERLPIVKCQGVAFSSDSRSLVGRVDDRLHVWSMRDGRLVRTVPFAGGSVTEGEYALEPTPTPDIFLMRNLFPRAWFGRPNPARPDQPLWQQSLLVNARTASGLLPVGMTQRIAADGTALWHGAALPEEPPPSGEQPGLANHPNRQGGGVANNRVNTSRDDAELVLRTASLDLSPALGRMAERVVPLVRRPVAVALVREGIEPRADDIPALNSPKQQPAIVAGLSDEYEPSPFVWPIGRMAGDPAATATTLVSEHFPLDWTATRMASLASQRSGGSYKSLGSLEDDPRAYLEQRLLRLLDRATGDPVGEPIVLEQAGGGASSGGDGGLSDESYRRTLPTVPRRLAYSPDGSKIAFVRALGGGAIVDLIDAEGRPLAAYRVFGSSRVDWLDWVDNETLLSIAGGRLARWQVADGTIVFERHRNHTPVVTLARRDDGSAAWAAVALGGVVELIDLSDGRVLGFVGLAAEAVEVPGLIAATDHRPNIRNDEPFASLALSPDHRTLIGYRRGMEVFDLTEGTGVRVHHGSWFVAERKGAATVFASRFPTVPVAGAEVRFLSPTAVASIGARTDLFDLTSQRIEALTRDPVPAVAAGPSGLPWVTASSSQTVERNGRRTTVFPLRRWHRQNWWDPGRDNPIALAVARAGGDGRNEDDESRDELTPVGPLIDGEAVPMTIEVDFGEAAFSQRFAREAAAYLTTHGREIGIGGLTLRFTAEVVEAGPNNCPLAANLAGAFEGKTIKLPQVNWEVRMVRPDGSDKRLWFGVGSFLCEKSRYFKRTSEGKPIETWEFPKAPYVAIAEEILQRRVGFSLGKVFGQPEAAVVVEQSNEPDPAILPYTVP